MDLRNQTFLDLAGTRVLVVGLGKSGLAASRVLREKGARVSACDIRTAADLGATTLDQLKNRGITVFAGGYPTITQADFDLLVTSPGIPRTVEPLQRAEELGIPIWGELELAFQYSPAPFLGITGTNGKTTTTALVGEILKNAHYPSIVGGNIGLPLVEEVIRLRPESTVVAEISSFQLEGIEAFRAHIAVILNITPDHLDRHYTMDGYIAAKARIFENQTPEDYLVLNYDDPLTQAFAKQAKAKVLFFSRLAPLDQGVFLRAGQIVAKIGAEEIVLLPATEVKILGAHNLENALAAVASTLVLGVQPEIIGQTLRSFSGVAHRLEFVAEIQNVQYINDSKGTNPDAAIKALETYPNPLVLIAGGKNKGSDFTEFAARIKERVRTLVLVGQAGPDIQRAVQKTGFTEIYSVQTFPEAVNTAARLAQPGDVVLLSPACASWDMFNSFEERGDLFKQLVYALAE